MFRKLMGFLERFRLHTAQRYYDRGDLEKALAILNDLASNYPANPEYLCFRSGIFVGLRRLNEALEDCNKAIELDNRRAQSFYYRAFCQKHLGEIAAAIDDITIAKRLDPTDVRIRQLASELQRRE